MGAHEEHLGPAVHHARSLPGQPASRQAADLARTLKALADPTRLRLVSMVAAHEGREACVCELTEPLGLTQPTVSLHPPWSHRDDPPATS
ncbi:MAG TPA: metalloregulator ArsR/SmtB family transcription factor [Streptosporangiaceae bacterium]|nr:metalloregulator ArsR/SmtB family transcription factor [Streptosporangiaceae bacterium]